MALPVSAEFPMVGFSQFDPSNPPAIPQVQVQPVVAHLIPMVSSSVANEASNKAHANAARMFCYNLLVNCYWNNENFSEVVKLVTDLVALQYNKGNTRIPESIVQESTSQILTLYTSNLIFLYPDLKSIVSPQVLDAAYGNVQTFNNLKQEILGMYNHNQMYPQGTFPGPNMGAHAHAPMPHPGMYPNSGHPGMVQGGYPHHMHPAMNPPQMVHHHPGGFGHPQASPGHTGFGNPNGGPHAGATMARIGTDLGNEGANIRQDRFFTRPTSSGVQVAREEPRTQPQRQETPASVVTAPTHLVIDKGSEMDRAKHQITLLGDSYSTDSLTRGRLLAESTRVLVEERPAEETEIPHHVHPALIMEPCLETAIITGRVKQFEHQAAESTSNLFRCFAFIATPMVCVEDVKPFVDNLREATSFSQLIVKIKSLATSLATKSQNKRYTDTIISFLKQFDNLLTELVNDFLRNKLRLKASIDSFTDDAADLQNYLHNKYGSLSAQAYGRFENEVITSLLEEIEQENHQDMVNLFDIPATMHTAIFPVNYSLTYTFMNDKELGYKLKKGDVPVAIDRHTAPCLYLMAGSLDSHKKQMQITTMYDLLITADNVIYKLYRNYVVDGEYLIAKV